MNKIRKKINKKRIWENLIKLDTFIIIIGFFFSTIYFIYQFNKNYSWDFQSYFLNYLYLYGNGNYFELFRPPFSSFLMYIVSFFNFLINTEILYIILVSILFLISSYLLAKKLNFNPAIYYGLSLTPFLLSYGLVNGTELLQISMLNFAFYFLFADNIFSGLFLGFSALTRYNTLVLFPLLLFQKKFSKIFFSLFLFFISLVPWFLFNYFYSGNYFTSIVDQYANNILFRLGQSQPINLTHFFHLFNFILPFFLIGLIKIFVDLFKKIKLFLMKIKEERKINIILIFLLEERINIIFLLVLFYTIYSYVSTPFKHERYLFSSLFSITYFSYIGLYYIKSFFRIRLKTLKLFVLFFIIFSFSFLLVLENLNMIYYENNNFYKGIYNDLKEDHFEKCQLYSNIWVLLNGVGLNSEPFPEKAEFNKIINRGGKIVIHKHVYDPEYVKNTTFLYSFPIILNTSNLIIIGNNNSCEKWHEYNKTFLEVVKKRYELNNNSKLNINSCHILFKDYYYLEKFCHIINFEN